MLRQTLQQTKKDSTMSVKDHPSEKTATARDPYRESIDNLAEEVISIEQEARELGEGLAEIEADMQGHQKNLDECWALLAEYKRLIALAKSKEIINS